jgi:hydrogenase maturation protease
MPRVLIIGWGNPLRGDDGLGWRAAESLAAALKGQDVTIRVSHQLMPELAEEISRSELVIFIDAACHNSPGELRFERVEPRCPPSATFSHQMNPEALTGMAKRLYGFCPDAFLFSVGGRSFEFGEELSSEVQAALPALVRKVQEVCGGLAEAARHS